jgi:N-acylneuraminate cytidylyltransferase
LPLSGRPLITWSISQALAVGRVKRCIVSTDSEEIASVARAAGAEVPFMRPAELAQDNSPEWLSWRHALDFIKQNDGAYPAALLIVPATAPCRSVDDLDRCLDEYERNDVDVVITVTDAHRSPYFNMVMVEADGTTKLVIPPVDIVTRRQDAPLVYDVTTVGYVVRPEYVVTKKGIFEGKVRHVHVPIERAIDIDTQLDFKIAQYLMDNKEDY